jgi:Co/Zn/Cd efflux system component
LVVAAFCVSPARDGRILGLLILLPAVYGLGNSVVTGMLMLEATHERSQGMDVWAARVVVPVLCFVALLVSALGIALSGIGWALPIMAGVTVVLLVVGIRNSWTAVIVLAGQRAPAAHGNG